MAVEYRLAKRWRNLFAVQTVLTIGLLLVPLTILIVSALLDSSKPHMPPNDSKLTLILSSLILFVLGSITAVGTIISTGLFLHRYRSDITAKGIRRWVQTLLVGTLVLTIPPIAYFFLSNGG